MEGGGRGAGVNLQKIRIHGREWVNKSTELTATAIKRCLKATESYQNLSERYSVK